MKHVRWFPDRFSQIAYESRLRMRLDFHDLFCYITSVELSMMVDLYTSESLCRLD